MLAGAAIGAAVALPAVYLAIVVSGEPGAAAEIWSSRTLRLIARSLGLAAAVLFRVESDEPRRECPGCGKVVKLHDALCTRCGTELEWTDEILPPESAAAGR